MKKYLISIEQAGSPRLEAFFNNVTFQKYQQEFQKFGVIGANLSTKQYFHYAVAGKQRPLSPAELGCTLSHVQALQDFLSSDEKYACIFEDDAISILDFDLNDLEQEVEALNLKDTFYLSLGGIQLKVNQKVRGHFLTGTLKNKKVLHVNLLYIRRFSYAYAYVIDRKMAEVFLKYHESPKVYDHWGELYDENSHIHFYATHLFDHPELDECAAGQSYLELERQTLQYKNKKGKKKNIWGRLKISLIKRIYKMTLKKYN